MKVHKTTSVLAIAVGLLATSVWTHGEASAQTWRTMTSSRMVQGDEPVDVEIEYGAGRLTVEPGDSRRLYQMELRYDEEAFEPRVDFDADDRELYLGVESIRGHRGRNLRDGARATISLSRDVPLDLELQFGAGEAEIELGGMTLRTLEIATGASDTDITFSEPNRIAASSVIIQAGAADLRVMGIGNTRAREVEFEGGVGATVLDFSGASADINASVEMGVGSVTLRLPRSHGIRLNRSSFLTSFDEGGLTRRDGSYFSSNYETAAHKLTIDISAALGSIDIDWVD